MGGKARRKPGVVLWATRGDRNTAFVNFWRERPMRVKGRWFGHPAGVASGEIRDEAGVGLGECRRVRVTVELLGDDDAT